MAQVFISGAFAREREEGVFAPYEIWGKAVKDIGDSIAQTMLYYTQTKKKEEDDNMALLGHLIDTYKDHVGQPALRSYDEMLQKKSKGRFGLPRDSEGNFKAPDPTADELISRQMKQDPELLKQAAVKKATGVSPFAMNLANMKEQRLQEYNDRMANAAELRATAADWKAHHPAAGKMAEDMLTSEWVRLPDGSLTTHVEVTKGGTEPLPPGAEPLSIGEAKVALQKYEKDMDRKLKETRADLDRMKFLNAIQTQSGKVLLDLGKQMMNPKTDPKWRARMMPMYREMLKGIGVADENLAKFTESDPAWGLAWLTNLLYGPGKAIAEQTDKEHQTRGTPDTPIPGQLKTKSGKILYEDIIPDATTTTTSPGTTTTTEPQLPSGLIPPGQSATPQLGAGWQPGMPPAVP